MTELERAINARELDEIFSFAYNRGMKQTSADRRYLIYLAIVSGTLILGGVVLLTYGVMFL